MTLPVSRILDDALSAEAHAEWSKRVQGLVDISTPVPGAWMRTSATEELLACAEVVCGRKLNLLAALMFKIQEGDPTTPHVDFGEYVALYYPLDCPTGPLRVKGDDVKVVANRMYVFNATTLLHQQIPPKGGEVRYSVALKFKYPKRRT